MLRHALVLTFLLAAAAAQQVPDPGFRTKVEKPAYTKRHPLVVIDEAHRNFHTAAGRYQPLADMLRSDGYRVEPGTTTFDKPIRADVLIISNARGADKDDAPAFTPAEADALHAWVKRGGALLFIADHAPFGGAAAGLAQRFGIKMGKGYAMNPEPQHTAHGPSIMVFSEENGLLGAHPIVGGRNAAERVRRVVAFTGQSLAPPPGATALLKLGPDSFEPPDSRASMTTMPALGYQGMERKGAPDPAAIAELKKKYPVAGNAQATAFKLGKGRVVVVGEAAMFSAQVLRYKDEQGNERVTRMGMNVEDNDDRQFALNILHWLSGALK